MVCVKVELWLIVQHELVGSYARTELHREAEPVRIGGERKLQLWRWGAAYYTQFWRELWYWRNVRRAAADGSPELSAQLSPTASLSAPQLPSE